MKSQEQGWKLVTFQGILVSYLFKFFIVWWNQELPFDINEANTL